MSKRMLFIEVKGSIAYEVDDSITDYALKNEVQSGTLTPDHLDAYPWAKRAPEMDFLKVCRGGVIEVINNEGSTMAVGKIPNLCKED